MESELLSWIAYTSGGARQGSEVTSCLLFVRKFLDAKRTKKQIGECDDSGVQWKMEGEGWVVTLFVSNSGIFLKWFVFRGHFLVESIINGLERFDLAQTHM